MPNPGIPTYDAVSQYYIKAGYDDPTSVPTLGQIGTIYVQRYPIGVTGPTNAWQKILTNGTDTNWLSLGSGGSSIIEDKKTAALTAPQISGGFPLDFIAIPNSTVVNPQGALILVEGPSLDYQVVNGLVSTIVFSPAVQALLEVGQIIQVQYFHL